MPVIIRVSFFGHLSLFFHFSHTNIDGYPAEQADDNSCRYLDFLSQLHVKRKKKTYQLLKMQISIALKKCNYTNLLRKYNTKRKSTEKHADNFSASLTASPEQNTSHKLRSANPTIRKPIQLLSVITVGLMRYQSYGQRGGRDCLRQLQAEHPNTQLLAHTALQICVCIHSSSLQLADLHTQTCLCLMGQHSFHSFLLKT